MPGVVEPFLLTARADRVDVAASGYILTDYKTGGVPSKKRVDSGASPQLPLEAAIAQHVGLGTLPPGPATRLVYIRATGGDPPADVIEATKGNVPALAAATLAQLTDLVKAYDDPDKPYTALRRPGFQYDYDDYDHLARVQEWLAADLTGDSEGADDASPHDGDGEG